LNYNLYLAANLNTDPDIIEKLKKGFNGI